MDNRNENENQDEDEEELDLLDGDDESDGDGEYEDEYDEDLDLEDIEEEDLDEVVPGITGVAAAMSMVGPVEDSLRIKSREQNESVVTNCKSDDVDEDSSFDPDFCDIPDTLDISYEISYNDAFDCLNATDKVDGTIKSSKKWVMIMGVLCSLELISFFQTQNGFAFVFALIFGFMAIFLQKKTFGVNHKIAKSFEAEKNQNIELKNNTMIINNHEVKYDDAKMYELDKSYCLIYEKNRTLPIPKSVLSLQQKTELERKFKSVLGDRYNKLT